MSYLSSHSIKATQTHQNIPINSASILNKLPKVYLMILDGFGEGKQYIGNAIQQAHMSELQRLRSTYPSTLLQASGNAVGLPEGTQGGSEVGHFTIGAGRVVFQFLERINKSIEAGSFFQKKPLLDAMNHVTSAKGSRLHLLGMISDQGVHAHLNHLFALLELAKQHQVKQVFIHAITDGRDVPEKSALHFIELIQKKIEELGMTSDPQSKSSAVIASIIGRFYAMDRDHNWDRTQKAYDLYTLGKGFDADNAVKAIANAYDRGIATDYYIDPIIVRKDGLIEDQDTVIFWNYRTDRTRQLTQCFTGEADIGFAPEKKVRPFFVCFGDYSSVAPVVFPTEKVMNNLGEVLSRYGLSQLRIAETEKYAHVTYFFNSQVEAPFFGEDRLLIDSPKVASYAQKPEMSARQVTDSVIKAMDEKDYALIVQNFANPDLVGHSGNMKAAVQACEVVDECIGKIVSKALEKGYNLIITADHGNAEYMIYEENGEQCPSHTTNPVICILVSSKYQNSHLRSLGVLSDIAPTILDIMDLPKPAEMTGESLFLDEK